MNTNRRKMTRWVMGALLILISSAVFVGCGSSKNKEKEESERKAAAAQRASAFAAFAKEHGAIPFEPEPTDLISFGQDMTADIQRKLTGAQAVAVSLTFADVRVVGGQTRLCSSHLSDFGWRMDLAIDEDQIAVVRDARSRHHEIWVIAKIDSTDAHEEVSTGEGTTSRHLIVICSGRAFVCRAAPE